MIKADAEVIEAVTERLYAHTKEIRRLQAELQEYKSKCSVHETSCTTAEVVRLSKENEQLREDCQGYRESIARARKDDDAIVASLRRQVKAQAELYNTDTTRLQAQLDVAVYTKEEHEKKLAGALQANKNLATLVSCLKHDKAGLSHAVSALQEEHEKKVQALNHGPGGVHDYDREANALKKRLIRVERFILRACAYIPENAFKLRMDVMQYMTEHPNNAIIPGDKPLFRDGKLPFSHDPKNPVTVQVPVKYLGVNVGNLLASLEKREAVAMELLRDWVTFVRQDMFRHGAVALPDLVTRTETFNHDD